MQPARTAHASGQAFSPPRQPAGNALCLPFAMNISVFQHAISEGPGEIESWAHKRFHHVETRHLYRGDALPLWSSFDLLVVMGGEMNIYQYRDWPWLKPERELIEAALAAGKPVIGICLGSQLIADALGSRVTQNPEIELGWQPVTWTPEARAYCPDIPAESTVLHWHGDTFELPEGATRLAASGVCAEQGYVIPGKCLGLQFHMEVDPKITADYVASQPDWPNGAYVQSPEEVLAQAEKFCPANRQVLFALLDTLRGGYPATSIAAPKTPALSPSVGLSSAASNVGLKMCWRIFSRVASE